MIYCGHSWSGETHLRLLIPSPGRSVTRVNVNKAQPNDTTPGVTPAKKKRDVTVGENKNENLHIQYAIVTCVEVTVLQQALSAQHSTPPPDQNKRSMETLGLWLNISMEQREECHGVGSERYNSECNRIASHQVKSTAPTTPLTPLHPYSYPHPCHRSYPCPYRYRYRCRYCCRYCHCTLTGARR